MSAAVLAMAAAAAEFAVIAGLVAWLVRALCRLDKAHRLVRQLLKENDDLSADLCLTRAALDGAVDMLALDLAALPTTEGGDR